MSLFVANLSLRVIGYKDIIKYKIHMRFGGGCMAQTMQGLMKQYVSELQNVYGSHLCQVILNGSYARGDYNSESDVEIKPIVKTESHYQKWVEYYPFYTNIEREGVTLYATDGM